MGSSQPQQLSITDLLTESRLKLLELHFGQLAYEKLEVDFSQFSRMLDNAIGKTFDRKELEIIFNKIDTLSMGVIDWNGFISYVASEMQMREQILSIYEGALKTNFHIVKPGHQENICAVDIMPHLSPDACSVDYVSGRYITTSKDGCIRVWTQQWQLMKSKHCISEWTGRKKNSCMLHMTCLPNAFVIAVAAVNESINFYDYTSNKMDQLCSICEIGAIVTYLHYWFNTSRPEEGNLTFGDSAGNVTHLHFTDCLDNKLFGLPHTKRNIQKISFADILNNKNKFVSALHYAPLHEEWVKQVCYVPALKSTLSCSLNSTYSMVLQSTVLDMPRRIFGVNKGINCFDYNSKIGVIATGGIDRCLRIWNPFVNKRCVATFYGHSAPITHILIIAEAEQVFSLSADKTVKVWDLKEENCIQSVFGQVIPTGPYPITCFFHNKVKRQIILATSHVITIDRLWDAGGHDYMNFLTHPKALTGVLYSKMYNQVITACEQGVIIFWRLDNGQKCFQITNAHSINVDGLATGVEITAMSLDDYKKALLTAGQDNFIKMWNLSNGSILRTLYLPNFQEINAILPTKKNIYYAGWDRRVFRTNTNLDKDSIKLWPIRHEDDILDMAYLEPNILITCSWDGKTKLWVIELGIVKMTFSLFDYFSEKKINFKLSGTAAFRSESLRSNWKGMKTKSYQASFSSETSSGKITKKPKFTQKLADKNALYEIASSPPAFTCMLVLDKRKPNISTGNLLLANMNGVIEVWSTHLTGEPLAIFHSVSKANHFVTSMATDPHNNYFLFTGDSQGYIRVWYIRYYHNAAETFNPEDASDQNEDIARFPFMRTGQGSLSNKIKNDMANLQITEMAEWLDVKHPQILSSFRAHLTTIKQITYVPDRQLLLTASSDQSVRFWTDTGRYLATFGDNRGWNLNSLLTKKVKPVDRVVPYDIRQHGSAVTLQVLQFDRNSRACNIEMDGIGNLWSKARYLFYYLYVKAVMRQKLTTTKLEVPVESITKGLTIENLQRIKKEQELLQLGSPLGLLFKFKKCPKRKLMLPSKRRAILAHTTHTIPAINLDDVLSQLSHDSYCKLKYKQKGCAGPSQTPLKRLSRYI